MQAAEMAASYCCPTIGNALPIDDGGTVLAILKRDDLTAGLLADFGRIVSEQ
jgi:hypothetical protein